MGQPQQDFTDLLRENATQIMQVVESVRKSIDVAGARGYATTWTDADFSDVMIAGRPATKAEVIALVGVVDDLIAFVGNQPVATQDRAAVFNKYRSDL